MDYQTDDLGALLENRDSQIFRKNTESFEGLKARIDKKILDDMKADLPALRMQNNDLTTWLEKVKNDLREPEIFISEHRNKAYKEELIKLKETIEGALNVVDLRIKNKEQSSENQTDTVIRKKEFTLSRQVLAISYLLDYCSVKNVDITDKAKFIQFLTGRQTGAKDIRNTEIYKKLRNLLSKNDVALTEDLQFLRTYFEKLGIDRIVGDINKEIMSREK